MPDEPRTRALIVEDEPMLAFMLEELLIDAGFAVSGIASRLEAALRLIAQGDYDVVILDANLAGVSAAPAASALKARGAPFVVLSGYSADQHKDAFSGSIRLQKPCSAERLIEALRDIAPVG
jgi:DNA-binding response OmpR family regulator